MSFMRVFAQRHRTELIAGMVVFLLLAAAYLLDLFVPMRLQASDLLLTNDRRSDNIVIIAIDDASLAAYGRSPLQWSRAEYARAVRNLSAAGARVIAFELLLSEPGPGDALLAEALADARMSEARTRIVIAAAGVGAHALVTTPEGMPALRFKNSLLPTVSLRERADYIGFADTLPDADGLVRRMPLMIADADTARPTFSTAAYLAYLRLPSASLDQVAFVDDTGRVCLTEARCIPIDHQGLWHINIGGTPGQSFPVLSFRDVVEGTADLSLIEDRVALIGLYRTTGAVDTFSVPLAAGMEMAGVEIQAHALATLIEGSALRSQSAPSTLLMLFLLSIGTAFLYGRLRWFLKPFVTLVLLVLLLLLAGYVYSSTYVKVDLLFGALALIGVTVASLLLGVNREVKRRQQAEKSAETTQREKRLVEAVLSGSPIAIATLDGGGRVVGMNDALRRQFTGVAAADQHRGFSERLAAAGLDSEAAQQIQKRFQGEADFETDLTLGEKQHIKLAARRLPDLGLWVAALADVSALVELSKLKRQMLLMVSHDLRNPLSSLFIYTSFLRKQANTMEARTVRFIDRIEESARVMQTILTDVMDLEQIRALDFPSEPIDLASVVRDVAARYEPDCMSKQQTLTIEIEDVPAVSAHRGQMSQVVANLVSNAVKYTLDHGTITLRLSPGANGFVRLEVQDTGIGIPQDAQERLFTEFYRVKTRATSEIPGTGLGLSIVKSVIEKYGGRVWCQSEEGVGTTFFVELPSMAASAGSHG